MHVRTRAAAAAVAVALGAAACSGAGEPDARDRAPAPTTVATTATTVPEPTGTSGCAARPPAAGVRATAMRFGGVRRAARRFLPSTYDGRTPVPLVVNLHGYLGNGDQQATLSGMEAFAERRGFAVLFPSSPTVPPRWNLTLAPDQPDDLGYLRALVAAAARRLCLDPARVFLTGMSNGAGMTSTAACHLADVFAAFAPVAGLHGPTFCDGPRPPDAPEASGGSPAAIVAFHGTRDEFLRYGGGFGTGAANLPRPPAEAAAALGDYPSPPRERAAAAWARRAGCGAATHGARGTEIRVHAWRGCDGGGEVVLYEVVGGGHAWPGSAASAAIASVVGYTTMEIDANEVMWRFFRRHPRPLASS